MAVVIAIDAGTTGVRSLAIDPSGTIKGWSYREFTQHFPGPGLGRARRGRDLGRGRHHDGRADGLGRRARRRHRHHRPAGDDRGLGPPHRRAPAPGHRLAGPAHRRPLPGPDRRRSPRHGPPAHGAGPRPLLLGHQAGVAARSRWGRGRRRPGLRHRRLVAPLEPHRRRGPRHRAHQRQPDPALRHRRGPVVRGAARPVRRARIVPARGPADQRAVRDDHRRPAGARRHPHQRHRRRPAGRPVRPGLLRAGHDQEHLRHRLVRPHERRDDLSRAGRGPADHHRVAAGRR